ncbi:MAG: four helix bundle protein [Bacteroidia bacterium]
MEDSFADKLKKRTKELAVSVIKYSRKIPKSEEGYIVKKQLIRSATSVAANYRACCRGRSEAEFFAKLSIAVEEADETAFWLEIIEEAEIHSGPEHSKVAAEANEILKILARSRKTLKDKRQSKTDKLSEPKVKYKRKDKLMLTH